MRTVFQHLPVFAQADVRETRKLWGNGAVDMMREFFVILSLKWRLLNRPDR